MPNTDLQGGASDGTSQPVAGRYSLRNSPNGALMPANARAVPLESPVADATRQASQFADRVAQDSQKAAADMWHLQAVANDENTANDILAQAQANRKPGQPIKDAVAQQFKQYQDKQLAQDMGEGLKIKYQESLLRIQSGLVARAQEDDKQEVIRNTFENSKNAIDNLGRSYSYLNTPQEVDKKLQADTGMYNSMINNLPIPQEYKQKMREYALQNLPDVAMKRIIDINPHMAEAYTKGGFEHAHSVVSAIEGGFVANDAGKGPTLYGINSSANPDEYTQMKALYDKGDTAGAKALAKQTYKTKYWDAIGGDSLPPQMAMMAFDAAVNQGVGASKEMLKESGGDPQKFMELRQQRYEDAAKNPDLAGYLPAWEKRLSDVSSASSGFSAFRLGKPEQREKWIQEAETQARRVDLETEKQKTLQNSVFNADFGVAVERGEKTYAEINKARQDGLITPQQWEGYTKKLDEFNHNTLKDKASIQRVGLALGGQAVLDPNNSEDKTAVDTHYAAWEKTMQAQGATQDMQGFRKQQMDLVGRYGMVPKTMQGEIRSKLRSTNPDDMADAASSISMLQQKNPALLKDFSDGDISGAVTFQSYVSAGYSPKDAFSVMAANQKASPEMRKSREEAFKEELKKTTPESMLQSGLTSWVPFTDKFSNPATMPSEMQAEFKQAAEAEYVRTGNMDAAQKVALARIQKTWGVTHIANSLDGQTSGAYWMKNPPEQFYSAPVAMSPKDNAAWMREQMIEDMDKSDTLSGKHYTTDNLMLTVAPQKLPDGRPTYHIWYKDKDGVVNMFGGENFTWFPDWQKSKERGRMLRRARDGGASELPRYDTIGPLG